MQLIFKQHQNFLLILSILLFTACADKKAGKTDSALNAVAETPKKEWTAIFNGKNLEGWVMKVRGYPLGENFGITFRVENGILSIRYDQYGANFDNRFGGLYFDKMLTNYRFRAEYRFVGETAPGAPEWGYRDSGIQFHSQPPTSLKVDDAFPICLEYNLHGGNGSDERPVGAICANGMFVEVNGEKNTSYCTPAFKGRTFHGDQWVTLEIEVNNGQITHFVNGEEIIKYANPTYDSTNEIAKTFITDEGGAVTGGYLSIQSNSHPIDFRKIELLEYQ